MTKGECLACTDPTPMLEYLKGKANCRHEIRADRLRCTACRAV